MPKTISTKKYVTRNSFYYFRRPDDKWLQWKLEYLTEMSNRQHDKATTWLELITDVEKGLAYFEHKKLPKEYKKQFEQIAKKYHQLHEKIFLGYERFLNQQTTE